MGLGDRRGAEHREQDSVVGPLTDPARYGGDPADAFHLVLPTLPGFGFSPHPDAPGWDLARTADAWIALMDRLGYEEYFAEGGDLGAGVTDEMAARRPAGLKGIHLTFAMFMPTAAERADATADEQEMLAQLDPQRPRAPWASDYRPHP